LPTAEISEVAAELPAPSPAWLAERLTFAPGMAALLDGFGGAKAEIIAAFRERLETLRGAGPVSLGARAYLGSATIAHA
jgi:hypothetical protein